MHTYIAHTCIIINTCITLHYITVQDRTVQYSTLPTHIHDIHTYIHSFITYIHIYSLHTYSPTVHEYIHTCIHTHTHTYIHTYIEHTYIHTCIHASLHTLQAHITTYTHTVIQQFMCMCMHVLMHYTTHVQLFYGFYILHWCVWICKCVCMYVCMYVWNPFFTSYVHVHILFMCQVMKQVCAKIENLTSASKSERQAISAAHGGSVCMYVWVWDVCVWILFDSYMYQDCSMHGWLRGTMHVCMYASVCVMSCK